MYRERVLGRKQIGSAVRAVCAIRGIELSLIVNPDGTLLRRRKLDTDVHTGRYAITVPFVSITPVNNSFSFSAVVNICSIVLYTRFGSFKGGGSEEPFDCLASVLIRT